MRARERWLAYNAGELDMRLRVAAWHAEARRFADAARYYQEANEVDPFLRELHAAWGAALMELGRHAEALREFEVALLVPPDLDGVSLLPAIQGTPDTDLWAYGETGASYMEVDPDLHYPGVRGKHRMIRTKDSKLILVPRPEGDRKSLYDLEKDPGESTDVAREHAGATLCR